MGNTGNTFILLGQPACTQLLARGGECIAVIALHHAAHRMEIPQVVAQVFLCDIHFIRPFHQSPGLLMDSLVCRYLIKIVEHLSEVNTVMADAIPCEQAYQITAAGVDRCRSLLGIGQD